MSESDAISPVPELIPARMLNAFAFCPRLAYLEWVQGEFEDNAETLEGTLRHRRVDVEAGALPQFEPEAEAGEHLHARSVLLSGATCGFIARIDLLELDGPQATPVDYKRGKTPATPERAWEPERIQLCAQGLILREHGYQCNSGVLYFVDSKIR